MILPFTANALSATTVNTIKGTEPYLVLLDGPGGTPGSKLLTSSQLLGFSMPGTGGVRQTYDSSQSITQGGSAILAPKGMKFSDVVALVQANNVATIIPSNLQMDSDGDTGAPEGTVTATWYNGSTSDSDKIVNKLDQTFSACGGPYYLKISTNAVKAKTTYGDPKEKAYDSDSVIYRFTGQDVGICYLKPTSMRNMGASDPAVFNATNGFSYRSGFPTVGFRGASFALITSDANQSNYKCELDSDNASNWVTLSGAASSNMGQNCQLTLNTDIRPTNPIRINLLYNNGGTWEQRADYIIKAPVIWAIPYTTQIPYANNSNIAYANRFDALDVCRSRAGENVTGGNRTTWQQAVGQNPEDREFRRKYMFSRSDYTNSPQANANIYPEGVSSNIGGSTGYTRRVDSTLMGEWGTLTDYPSSGWVTFTWFWTVETHSSSGMFTIRALSGSVGYGGGNDIASTACRG